MSWHEWHANGTQMARKSKLCIAEMPLTIHLDECISNESHSQKERKKNDKVNDKKQRE